MRFPPPRGTPARRGSRHRPVLPKPPAALCDCEKSSTTSNVACTTGTMTSCARRSSGCSVNASCAPVPAADHQRALVIGIDESDQIAEDDPVLVAESGARKDHGSKSRVADVDGDARRNQFRAARRDRQRGADAGAQVEAGRAGCRIRGQVIADALVEHLDGNRVSHGSTLRIQLIFLHNRYRRPGNGAPCSRRIVVRSATTTSNAGFASSVM